MGNGGWDGWCERGALLLRGAAGVAYSLPQLHSRPSGTVEGDDLPLLAQPRWPPAHWHMPSDWPVAWAVGKLHLGSPREPSSRSNSGQRAAGPDHQLGASGVVIGKDGVGGVGSDAAAASGEIGSGCGRQAVDGGDEAQEVAGGGALGGSWASGASSPCGRRGMASSGGGR